MQIWIYLNLDEIYTAVGDPCLDPKQMDEIAFQTVKRIGEVKAQLEKLQESGWTFNMDRSGAVIATNDKIKNMNDANRDLISAGIRPTSCTMIL